MKILYIALNAAHQSHYIDAIYREGHEVFILTNDITFHLRRITVPNFEYSYQKVIGPILKGFLKKLIFRLPLPKKIMFLIRKYTDNFLTYYLEKLQHENFDIVISYKYFGLEYISKFQKNGSKWIIDEVNTHPEFSNYLLNKEAKKVGIKNKRFQIYNKESIDRIKQAYLQSDFILCPSKHVCKTIKKRIEDKKKIIINPYGCPYPIIKKKKSINRKIHIICIARIHFRKGIKYLLDLYNVLEKNYPEKFKLTIIGSETSQKGFNLENINPKIIFTGNKNKSFIKQQLLNSDIFILPSLEEGQALVIGEALAHGLPVISTPFSGAKDYIINKKLLKDSLNNYSIQIINPSDMNNFISSILNLTDKEIYKKASDGAIRIALENNWYSSGKELVKKLESLN